MERQCVDKPVTVYELVQAVAELTPDDEVAAIATAGLLRLPGCRRPNGSGWFRNAPGTRRSPRR
ncbi:DUF6192 family protein [Streptomyces sp. NPDC001414]